MKIGGWRSSEAMVTIPETVADTIGEWNNQPEDYLQNVHFQAIQSYKF